MFFFYVGACSFLNPLGGSYRVRTLTNKNLGRSLHCQKQDHLLNSSFYPSPFKRQVLKKFTISVDKFIYFALCYQLVIIDLIKTATVCGQIVPTHLSCFILASASSLWDIFFEQSSRKGSFFLRNMHRYKDKHYV